jgi:hypothetical protein
MEVIKMLAEEKELLNRRESLERQLENCRFKDQKLIQEWQDNERQLDNIKFSHKVGNENVF